MRTIREYEPSDIKLDGFAEGEKMDPVHSFLFAQFLVIGMTGFKPSPEDGTDVLAVPRRMIAQFLNHAQKSGISITKSELPDEFRKGFES